MKFNSKKIKYLFLAYIMLFSISIFGQKEKKAVNFEIVPTHRSIYKLIPKNAHLEVLSDESSWAEGPVILPDGKIIWSDIVNNRVLQWNKEEGTKVWLFPAQYQNGHILDQEGRLLAASHGKRAIERLEKDGSWSILVDLYEHKKLNSPNDLVLDKEGNIWFTDPMFGIKKENEGYGGNPVVGGEFVYRFNPTTKELFKLDTPEVLTPNGIALSKDQKTLYISDSQIEHTTRSHNTRNLVSYEIDSNKNVRNGKILFQTNSGIPDGMAVDQNDNIWLTSGNSIFIISPKGEEIGKLVFPVKVANLLFAKDNDKNVLYVTGTNYLFRINVLVGGVN